MGGEWNGGTEQEFWMWGGRTVRRGGSVLGRHQLDSVVGTEYPPLI